MVLFFNVRSYIMKACDTIIAYVNDYCTSYDSHLEVLYFLINKRILLLYVGLLS